MTSAPEQPEPIDPVDHLPLVHWWIKRSGFAARVKRNANIGIDDLVQVGYLGLRRAAESFDPARGCTFATYAVFWVRHACQRLLENESSTIRTPVHLQQTRRKAGQAPRAVVCSLDVPLGGDSFERENTRLDMLESVEAPVEAQLQLEALVARTPELSDTERKVMLRRARGERLQEIGDELGRSRERSRQVEAQAVLKIREMLVRDGELETLEVPRYIASQRAAAQRRKDERAPA